MGTWSKGMELGVVAVTLGLAFACGGKYDVGSGDTGGQAGEADAGETGSGGSSVSGQGGTDQGGSTTTGGRGGGVTSGGTAGVSAGGISGASGSATGGSAGVDACDFPVEILPPYVIASPDVVWDRITLFLHGSTRTPFAPLPSMADAAWAQERVRAVLEEQFVEDGRAPGGLEDFFRDWALEGEEGTTVEFWASTFVRGNFADFFERVDDRVSFVSDRDFLVRHPNSTRRGIWMMQNIIGFDVELAPPDLVIEPVLVPPGKTRRQAVEESVNDAACAGCHALYDPLGFSLEHYDALGDYRDVENGLPIDSAGTYSAPSAYLQFSSIDDLAGQFPALCEVQSAFAKTLFEYALDKAHAGSPPAYDPIELRYVIREFREHDLQLLPLLQAIASTPAFLRE